MKHDIAKRYEMAKRTGRYHGLGDESDDFAGWIVTQWLQGKCLYQKLDHSYVEYMRFTRGRTGYARSTAKFTHSVYKLPAEQTNIDPTELSQFADRYLSREERIVLMLVCVWGFTNRDISKVFGLTEGHISRVMKLIKRIIKKNLK